MAIVIIIMVGFMNDIIVTFDKTSISYTKNIVKVDYPEKTTIKASSDENFMFAVQVQGLNLSSAVRYFDIVSYVLDFTPGSSDYIDFPLVQCTP